MKKAAGTTQTVIVTRSWSVIGAATASRRFRDEWKALLTLAGALLASNG